MGNLGDTLLKVEKISNKMLILIDTMTNKFRTEPSEMHDKLLFQWQQIVDKKDTTRDVLLGAVYSNLMARTKKIAHNFQIFKDSNIMLEFNGMLNRETLQSRIRLHDELLRRNFGIQIGAIGATELERDLINYKIQTITNYCASEVKLYNVYFPAFIGTKFNYHKKIDGWIEGIKLRNAEILKTCDRDDIAGMVCVTALYMHYLTTLKHGK